MSRLKYWGSYGLLLLTLLLSLFYAIAFNSDLGWYVFVFITLFIFLTLVSTVNFNQDISLKVRDDTYTNVGEQNKIHLLIESPKRVFFPILKIENDTLGISENLFWFYGQRKELVIHWVAKERMKQEFVVFEVSKQDIFGVIKKKESYHVPMNLMVLPLPLRDVSGILNLISPMIGTTLYGENSFDLERLRPYVYGDSFKQIDWKLTSKKQELMYREYEQYERKKVLFLFYGVRSFYFEKMLQVFFSLYLLLDSQDYHFQIKGEGIDSLNDISVEDFASLIKSDDPGSLEEAKADYIVIFTPEITKRLKKELSSFDQGLQIQVISFEEIERSLS